MSSILLWMSTPIRGWKIETLEGQRETDGRGWLLQALLHHHAGDYAALWNLLNQRLPGGRLAIAELVEGLLDQHAELARARGCEELFASEKAKGYRRLYLEVENLVDEALRELGPAKRCQENTERLELEWPCGSVLRFDRGPSGIFWRDATGDLVAEIEARAELPPLVCGFTPVDDSQACQLAPGHPGLCDWHVDHPFNEEPDPSAPPSTSRVEADNSMATEAAPEAIACSPEVTHAQPTGPAPIHHDQEEVLDPGLALKETLRLARAELAEQLDAQGRIVPTGAGRCVLCAGGIEGRAAVELVSESEGDRVLAHPACVKEAVARRDTKPEIAPSLPVAAAELRRLHVLARARAAAEQVLATSDHRTFWEVLIDCGTRRIQHQWMCAACGLGGAGEEAHVRDAGPDGVVHAIHPRCAAIAIEQERTIYGTGAEMRAWLNERGVQVGAVRVGALEAACLAYRRMQDVLAIEWERKTIRTAKRKAGECCLCGGAIAIGMQYADGAKGRAAHLPCAGVEAPKKDGAAA